MKSAETGGDRRPIRPVVPSDVATHGPIVSATDTTQANNPIVSIRDAATHGPIVSATDTTQASNPIVSIRDAATPEAVVSATRRVRVHNPIVSIRDAATPKQPYKAPDRALPEWSERDARLLKWLLGPQRESLPNTRLERSEVKDIETRLQRLMEYLTETQKLTAEQLEAMKATLDETRKASERLGRKDWLLVGIGALTTLAINVVFPPATVVHVTKLFIHDVAHLFSKELTG
jgi:hypothetical protein